MNNETGISVHLRDFLWEVEYIKMKSKRDNCGLSHHPLYGVWIHMLDRCYNPHYSRFHLWGGRGIKVCARWMSLKNFISDMGDSEGFTLDRIDPDGDYSPDNYRWTSRKTQSRNIRPSERERLSKAHSTIMKAKRFKTSHLRVVGVYR